MNPTLAPVNPATALVDRIEAEMDAAWAEAHEEDYAARRRDEAELLGRYPGLVAASDEQLISIVADPPNWMADVDEVAAVAAILLERRLAERGLLVPVG